VPLVDARYSHRDGHHAATATLPRLTDSLIRAEIPAKSGAKIIYDDKVTGFGIRITPGDARTFILRYRNSHGVERKMRIGAWPTWGVAAARKEAERLVREEINIGRDPLALREAARAALTANQLLDLYVASARFASKAPATQAIDLGRIDRHLRPTLGRKIVIELSPDQVQRAAGEIASGKTKGKVKTRKHGLARVEGGQGTARKAIQLLRAAFNWAIKERLLDANPAGGLDLGRDGVRNLLLMSADYKRLHSRLDQMQDSGEVSDRAADAIRIISFTGARRGEIAGLRSEHVDLKAKLIRLPPAAHKTGKATGQDRVILLPKVAIEILKRYRDDEIIFPFDGPRLTKIWNLVRDAAGLPKDFGLHGLRHSVASHLAMKGAGASEIMAAMGHTQLSTAQRYVHLAQDFKQRLAERAAGPSKAGMKKAR